MKNLSPSESKRGFRIHAIVFAPTMVLLVIVNALTGPPYWAFWAFLGWSIGLACHWWFAVGPGAARGRK